MDIEQNIADHAARKSAEFMDMHGKRLFERNKLPFNAKDASPENLEALGYTVDLQKEHKGNCTHYKMRLLKIVDIEEFSVKFTLSGI